MYTITERLDGSFTCECRLRDDCERWTSPTLEEAVREMKGAAKACNNAKIKRKDITILREVQRVVTMRERVG